MKDLEYVLTKDDESLYVKELLQRRFSFSSRLLRKLKVTGGPMLNGRPARLRDRGRAGDVLSVRMPGETSYFEPEPIPVAIAFEDDRLLVCDKQPGLVVHPTKNYQTGTLANALTYYMQGRGDVYKLRFVNRLDRDTSGLVIVAKDANAQDVLSRQMEEGSFVKRYVAIVHGILEGEGTIDLPIDKDPDHVARRMVRADGYPSVTHYRSLETIPSKDSGPIKGYSLVELGLETGRTHQIRVHLTHIGHPIVGDELYAQLYGYPDVPEWMPRQALHAAHIEFSHPGTGELVRCDAPVPADMLSCLEYLRSRR